eukprot:m.111573 g.111573  ORF g.111573 m.111573 type:complete len:1371 (+) comp51827_c0_seq1:1251-5363(+)
MAHSADLDEDGAFLSKVAYYARLHDPPAELGLDDSSQHHDDDLEDQEEDDQDQGFPDIQAEESEHHAGGRRRRRNIIQNRPVAATQVHFSLETPGEGTSREHTTIEDIYGALSSMNMYAPARSANVARSLPDQSELERRAQQERPHSQPAAAALSRRAQTSVRELQAVLQERHYRLILPPIFCQRISAQLLELEQMQTPLRDGEHELTAAIDAVRTCLTFYAEKHRAAGIALPSPVTEPEKREIESTISALETATRRVILDNCVRPSDTMRLIIREWLNPLIDVTRLTASILRATELFAEASPTESPDDDDTSFLVKLILLSGQKINAADFAEIFRRLLAWLVAAFDGTELVSMMCLVMLHCLQSRQWQLAFDAIASSRELEARLVQLREAHNYDQLASKLTGCLTDVCNDSLFAKVSPYGTTSVMCRLLLVFFGSDKQWIQAFLAQLDLHMQASRGLPHILLVTFLGADELPLAKQPSLSVCETFLEALVDTCKLPFFHNAGIVVGCEMRIRAVALEHIVKCPSKVMQDFMRRGGVDIPVHSLLSAPFVLFSRLWQLYKSPECFLQVLALSGNQATIQEQVNLLEADDPMTEDLVKDLAKKLDLLHQQYTVEIPALLQTFVMSTSGQLMTKAQRDSCTQRLGVLHALLEGKMVTMAKDLIGMDFVESVQKYLLVTLAHFLDLDKDQLIEVLTCANPLDKYPNGYEALLDAVRGVTSNNPLSWDTADLSNRLFYIYCYARYPLADFRRWFTDANIALQSTSNNGTSFHPLSQAEIQTIFTNFEPKREALIGRAEMEAVGFKCLQNNQVAAILAANQQVALGRHTFLKVGTGQGKSLIIAMLAAAYAKQGKRVQIFTCYEHLAERDYKRFESVFERMGFPTVFIKDQNSAFPKATRIVYSDLQNYYQTMQTHAKIRALNALTDIDSSGFFDDPNNDVCILDEFDSLILEHNQVCNTCYEFQELVHIEGFTKSAVTSGSKMLGLLHKHNDGLGSSFRALHKPLEIQKCADTIVKRQAAWEPRRKALDSLGRPVEYLGGALTEFSHGKFYSKAINIATLSHLRAFKHIIGLSGSINASEIKRFRSVFTQDVAYVEVPPFYGPASSRSQARNKLVTEKRGQSLEQWKNAIRQDFLAASADGRPVLVFANPDSKAQAEWDAAKEMIQTHIKSLGRKGAFLEILAEHNITKDTLERACKPYTITLSTHVAGRGADFSVQPAVNRLGGLHVIIGFEPPLTSDKGCVDSRMEDQMKGRTARMDRNGSHSIITTTKLRIGLGDQITADETKEEVYYIGLAVFRLLAGGPYRKEQWQRWIVANYFFRELSALPDVLNFVEFKDKDGKTHRRYLTRRERINYVAERVVGINNPQRERCVIL